MGRKDEFRIHQNIAEYLRLQYPDVVFLSTLNGIRLPPGQAKQAASLQCGRGIPDIIILESRRGYAGLCGEIKTSEGAVFRLNGDVRTDKHIQEQLDMLKVLQGKNYHASFWCGFENAKSVIDWYFRL